jgi:hypothetical protein
MAQPACEPAKPVMVMSQFDGSAWLKMAQLGWLSQFEPSCGNTIDTQWQLCQVP